VYTTDIQALDAEVLQDAAVAAGVPAEMHVCERAGHGKAIDTCPDAYRVRVNAFMYRVLGEG